MFTVNDKYIDKLEKKRLRPYSLKRSRIGGQLDNENSRYEPRDIDDSFSDRVLSIKFNEREIFDDDL